MKGVQLNVKMNEFQIYTDGQRFKQVLNNLLSNAQKFTFSGSVTIDVQEQTIHDQYFIKVSVQDTGSGMDQNTQTRLQEFLQQPHKRKSNLNYGLGLMISNTICNGLSPNYESGIHFQSNNKTGSLFWFFVEDLKTMDIPDVVIVIINTISSIVGELLNTIKYIVQVHIYLLKIYTNIIIIFNQTKITIEAFQNKVFLLVLAIIKDNHHLHSHQKENKNQLKNNQKIFQNQMMLFVLHTFLEKGQKNQKNTDILKLIKLQVNMLKKELKSLLLMMNLLISMHQLLCYQDQVLNVIQHIMVKKDQKNSNNNIIKSFLWILKCLS